MALTWQKIGKKEVTYLRERLDFSSLSKIILENRKTGMLTQTEYFFTLFSYAFEQTEVKIETLADAEISKIISGQRNITKDIIYIYQTTEGEKRMRDALIKIFECLSDEMYVEQQMLKLLWGDVTISDSLKHKLSACSGNTVIFVLGCMLFAMSRNFQPKGKKNEEKLLNLSDYLLDTRIPSVTKNFIGRERELTEINELMKKEHAVFLEGIGGIGKSELAKQYARQYGKNYANVLYLHYNESLRQTIAGLDFVDDKMNMSEDELFRNHYRFFKILDSRNLVILDNFNSVPEEDDLFHEFFSMGFQVLVTTRSHIIDMTCYEIKEISDIEILKQLFWIYAPSAKKDERVTEEIIKEVYSHTLTVELAAKTLIASGMDTRQFLGILQAEGVGISDPNKVIVKKDNRSRKQRLYQHIQTLFQIQQLSEISIYILRNMVLMPLSGISKKLFHEWQGINEWNYTNDLIEYGWIQEDLIHNKIALHPFIQEVLCLETKPSISNCVFLIKGIYETCICYGLDVPYYNELLNTIESIYENIIFDNEENAGLFMDTTMSYFMKYERIDAISKILERMKKLSTFQHSKMQMGIYDCYAGYVEYMKSNYKMAQQYFTHGLQLLESYKPVYANLYSNLCNNLAETYLAMGNVQNALIEVEKSMETRKRYGMVELHDSLQNMVTHAEIMAVNGKRQEARESLLTLIEQVEKIEDMKIYLGKMYFIVALVEQKSFPEDSLRHLQKAKEAFMQGYLPENHPDVKATDSLIMFQKGLVEGIQAGRLRIVSKR